MARCWTLPKTAMTGRAILYSFRRCPYAMRARLALLSSGRVCEIREVKLAAKPPELLAASPKATVPVLALPDGRVIDESLDIMRWALRGHDPNLWLDREDGALIAANDGPFKYHLDRYKYPERHASDPAEHRTAGARMMTALEERLAGYPCLCGAEIGLTDAAILPFVRQFAAIDPAWFAAQPLPRVRAWLGHFLDSALFAAAMVRLAPWRAGNPPTLFP